MLKKFELHIQKKQLFTKNNKLLLALSGGIDSVVLAYLLKEAGYTFALAHANFKLRGADSDADEKFCRELSKKLKVNIYNKSFDVKSYSKTHSVGTQLAARNLRYEWFNELLKENKYDYLVTAHHANDVLETFFINLLRGTGINGIKGIPEKNDTVVRPLLIFEKEEIQSYANENGIKYRIDKSNLEDKYTRNFIRLNIVPKLKELHPKLEQTFLNNSKHFREEASIVNDYLENRASEFITQTHDSLFINKTKLKKEKYLNSLLHYMITGYGFNASQENSILKNILSDALSGKYFFSATHQLFIDRNDLVIKPIHRTTFKELKFNSEKELKSKAFFRCALIKKFVMPGKKEVLLNPDQLVFPLTVRLKQTGDKFKPFGMKGFKLLSDFVKGEKMPLSQKEDCKVLVNGNGEIMWVVGYRSDERYKVDMNANSYLKLSYLD